MNHRNKQRTAGRNRFHPETGLRRIQLYLTRETIDVLDIENEMVLRDQNGRAVSLPSDRIQALLDIYLHVVGDHMPTASAAEWFGWMDRMAETYPRGLFTAAKQIAIDELNPPVPDLPAMAIAEAFRRFRTYDPALPARDRLIAAGCVLDDSPPQPQSEQ